MKRDEARGIRPAAASFSGHAQLRRPALRRRDFRKPRRAHGLSLALPLWSVYGLVSGARGGHAIPRGGPHAKSRFRGRNLCADRSSKRQACMPSQPSLVRSRLCHRLGKVPGAPSLLGRGLQDICQSESPFDDFPKPRRRCQPGQDYASCCAARFAKKALRLATGTSVRPPTFTASISRVRINS